MQWPLVGEQVPPSLHLLLFKGLSPPRHRLRTCSGKRLVWVLDVLGADYFRNFPVYIFTCVYLHYNFIFFLYSFLYLLLLSLVLLLLLLLSSSFIYLFFFKLFFILKDSLPPPAGNPPCITGCNLAEQYEKDFGHGHVMALCNIKLVESLFSLTAIPRRMHRISSDLRS